MVFVRFQIQAVGLFGLSSQLVLLEARLDVFNIDIGPLLVKWLEFVYYRDVVFLYVSYLAQCSSCSMCLRDCFYALWRFSFSPFMDKQQCHGNWYVISSDVSNRQICVSICLCCFICHLPFWESIPSLSCDYTNFIWILYSDVVF